MTFFHHNDTVDVPHGNTNTIDKETKSRNFSGVASGSTPGSTIGSAPSSTPGSSSRSATNSPGSASTSVRPTGRRRLSLFTFGLGSSSAPSSAGESKNKGLAAVSTSPSKPLHLNSSTLSGKSPLMKSPSLPVSRQHSSVSPVIPPVSETDVLSEKPDSHIFERSVQDMAGSVKQEDFIPPALDATASILSDSSTDLDNVEMVYSTRRNSSVIGLNMALGRPYTPSRKNSVYSMSHMNNGAHLASSSSLSYSQSFGGCIQGPGCQGSSGLGQGPQSPVSPPKLGSGTPSVSFYSYADMINNDEFSRRPSFMNGCSQGCVPTIGRQMSVTSNHSVGLVRSGSDINQFPRSSFQQISSPSESQSQLSKQFKDRSQCPPLSRSGEKAGAGGNVSPKNFLISPESSESEDQDEIFHLTSSATRRPISRRKSVASNASGVNSLNESDTFICSSVGECIRQCTTEIGNK